MSEITLEKKIEGCNLLIKENGNCPSDRKDLGLCCSHNGGDCFLKKERGHCGCEEDLLKFAKDFLASNACNKEKEFDPITDEYLLKDFTSFEEGSWYIWIGSSCRPSNWILSGEMDFMLSKKPFQCENTTDSMRAYFKDTSKGLYSNDCWDWSSGFEHIKKCVPCKSISGFVVPKIGQSPFDKLAKFGEDISTACGIPKGYLTKQFNWLSTEYANNSLHYLTSLINIKEDFPMTTCISKMKKIDFTHQSYFKRLKLVKSASKGETMYRTIVTIKSLDKTIEGKLKIICENETFEANTIDGLSILIQCAVSDKLSKTERRAYADGSIEILKESIVSPYKVIEDDE